MELKALLASERRFSWRDGAKLALERRFERPDGAKLEPDGTKLALERCSGDPMALH